MQMDFDFYGGIAQLGEHLPCKQGVMSSILIISTKAFNKSLKIPVDITIDTGIIETPQSVWKHKQLRSLYLEN